MRDINKSFPYIVIFNNYELEQDPEYEPLNPTGRWMININHYSDDEIFIEHKFKFLGMNLKRWISENLIEFLYERTSTIFDCNENL